MGIRGIESIAAKLECSSVGQMEDFLNSDVQIRIPRLAKVLNWASVACIEVEAAHRLKGSDIQERATHVEMTPGLSVGVRVWQEPRQAFSLKLDGHVTIR